MARALPHAVQVAARRHRMEKASRGLLDTVRCSIRQVRETVAGEQQRHVFQRSGAIPVECVGLRRLRRMTSGTTFQSWSPRLPRSDRDPRPPPQSTIISRTRASSALMANGVVRIAIPVQRKPEGLAALSA